MAITSHIVRIGEVRLDALGNIVKKTDSIKEVMTSTRVDRILEDINVPNSIGNPSVEDYLTAEAADNFILGHISQNLIVTYSATDINAV